MNYDARYVVAQHFACPVCGARTAAGIGEEHTAECLAERERENA